ncbi:hypothetical protein [Oryzicola mucosus]|uniref:Uncharacterized protein n=1 Tax=Oryzicola mucosus TaxID=2767425 RepID=A0A8J6PXQ1_9HYPH|nr:hypothetical protein [Oryzicola mucosus]MBD0417256.1 hypothetical protein [Oryzicola mucosus]
MTKIVSEEKAKQGRKGTHVLMILIVGLVLAAAVWFGVEMYGDMIDNAAQGQNSTTQPAP